MSKDPITAEFPTERLALRTDLLARVEGIADVIAANREASETGRTLAPAAVTALRESGLLRMKAPRVVGGAEAHPVTQMDVIEAVALIDPAASWSMFISSAVAGSALARLPDEGVAEVTSGGFPCIAGTLRPAGSAEPVEGGYRVSGRWAWGSGMNHADFFSALVLTGDSDQPVISVIVPAAEVIAHDTWFPLGMRGTGSADFELSDVFVPNHRVADVSRSAPRRGGSLFRLGMPGYVINEHGAFAYALAQAAIDEFVRMAVAKKRGYLMATSVADRAVVQRELSRAQRRTDACRLLMADTVEQLYAEAESDEGVSAETQAQGRAAATWCTDEAIEVVSSLFRYAGGGAVMSGSPFERLLRDLYTVQSHLVVSDVAYEIDGQFLLGLTDSTGMS